MVVLAAGLARRYGGCKPLAPIGPHGEAVLDLLVSDGLAAGFGEFVLVLHPETGPAIRYHVERTWPASVTVHFVDQSRPLGTVHAVLAAEPAIEPRRPFGVCNADDVYGQVAMRILAEQLESGAEEHVLVAFRLDSTVATGDPVTRGICAVDETGHLTGLQERRQVSRSSAGEFTADDEVEPKVLTPDLPTSVNLWGFRSAVWEVLHDAMDASGLEGEGRSGPKNAGGRRPRPRSCCRRSSPRWSPVERAPGAGRDDRDRVARRDPCRRPPRGQCRARPPSGLRNPAEQSLGCG